MPFITEELWAATAPTPRDTLLIVAEWPSIAAPQGADAATAEMHWVIDLIKGVRSVRAEMNVPAGAKIPLVLTGASEDSAGAAGAHIDVIATLARLSSAEAAPAIPEGLGPVRAGRGGGGAAAGRCHRLRQGTRAAGEGPEESRRTKSPASTPSCRTSSSSPRRRKRCWPNSARSGPRPRRWRRG